MDLENNLFLTSWDDQHSSKQIASDVRRFSISAHRLGYLTNEGELFVIQEPESEPELISDEVIFISTDRQSDRLHRFDRIVDGE